MAGFEPTTSFTPRTRAAKLRYTLKKKTKVVGFVPAVPLAAVALFDPFGTVGVVASARWHASILPNWRGLCFETQPFVLWSSYIIHLSRIDLSSSEIRVKGFEPSASPTRTARSAKLSYTLESQGDRIRTCDIVDPNHALCQTELHPERR